MPPVIATLSSRRTRRLALAALALPMALAACAVPPNTDPPTPFSITLTSPDPLVVTSNPSSYTGTISATIEDESLSNAANVEVVGLPAGWTVDQKSQSCSSGPGADTCKISARIVNSPKTAVSGAEFDVTLKALVDGVPVSVDTGVKVP